jgi:HPt (histidine-containing phosphotransfer) domain-containing protein
VNRHSAIDLSETLGAVAGNREFLVDLAGKYLGSQPETLERLREACQMGDAKALEREAHSFKSVTAIFGAAEASRLLSGLECAAEESRLDEAGELLKLIEWEIGRVHEDLARFMEEE